MADFKTLFKKSLQEISGHLPDIEVEYKDYDIISLNQYWDLREDRAVSNTGYMFVKLAHQNSHESLTLVFYFQRLYISKLLKFAEEQRKNPRNFRTKKAIPPAIKLNISGRKNGIEIKLNDSVDLVNIGTYRDQLSFGLVNRSEKREPWQKPRIDSKTDAPGEVIRKFIDQILQLYFEIKPNKNAL